MQAVLASARRACTLRAAHVSAAFHDDASTTLLPPPPSMRPSHRRAWARELRRLDGRSDGLWQSCQQLRQQTQCGHTACACMCPPCSMALLATVVGELACHVRIAKTRGRSTDGLVAIASTHACVSARLQFEMSCSTCTRQKHFFGAYSARLLTCQYEPYDRGPSC